MLEDISRIAIIGNGKMGTNIFYYMLNYSYPVVWICHKNPEREVLRHVFSKKLDKMVKSGLLTGKKCVELKNNIIISSDLHDVASCDMIIECITEYPEKKRQLFASLGEIVKNDCMVTSNTSSISLRKMYENYDRKENCAGLHFFYPVQVKNIVEINTTTHCHCDAIDKLKRFVASINKKALVLPESGNFILNKLMINFQAHAYLLYEENILSMQEIDDLVQHHLFPTGVFKFIDAVGLNIMLPAVINYSEHSTNKMLYQPWINRMEDLVKDGHSFASYEKMRGSDPVPGNKRLDDLSHDKYKKKALEKLTSLYLNSVFDVIAHEYCTEAEIDYAMGEYMGVEQGPVGLAAEIGFDKLSSMLVKYYKETGDQAFFPSSAILKKPF